MKVTENDRWAGMFFLSVLMIIGLIIRLIFVGDEVFCISMISAFLLLCWYCNKKIKKKGGKK